MPKELSNTRILEERIGAECFRLLPVPGGTFMDSQKRQITLPDFWLSEYPVTQALYAAVTGGLRPSYFVGAQRPVEQVSWYDALVFCNQLNELCGYAPCYFWDAGFSRVLGKTAAGQYELVEEKVPVFWNPAVSGYRLPMESESEYAALGGMAGIERGAYEYSGGNKLDELGWYEENSYNETKDVGLKWPNALGLYDMSGNVWEWCWDLWSEEGSYRVFRGGSWLNRAEHCRVAIRGDNWPGNRSNLIGFRLLFSVPSV
jgi:sulfatase modifying factor 1